MIFYTRANTDCKIIKGTRLYLNDVSRNWIEYDNVLAAITGSLLQKSFRQKFLIFTVKHLYRSLFFNKVVDSTHFLRAALL